METLTIGIADGARPWAGENNSRWRNDERARASGRIQRSVQLNASTNDVACRDDRKTRAEGKEHEATRRCSNDRHFETLHSAQPSS
jgi:hypothetical protein